MGAIRTLIVFTFIFSDLNYTKAENDSVFKTRYIETALNVGKVVPNGSFYSEIGFQKGANIDFGTYKAPDNYSWNSTFNYPFYGVQIGFSDYGNRKTFGYSLHITPYIIFRTSRSSNNGLDFKLGFGGAWLSQPFDLDKNPTNKAVGSHLNYTFHASVWHNLLTINNYKIKIGARYLHSSNGHVQLPNYGLNSATLSISAMRFPDATAMQNTYITERPESELKRKYFIDFNYGSGIHEFGNSSGPVGGEKKYVHSTYMGAGIIYKRYFKIGAGFSYRYYQHYYAYMNDREEYDKVNKLAESSNLFFSLSAEFIFGQVSIYTAGGLNFYKPFYDDYERIFRGSQTLDYWLRKLFNTRLAIQYYIFEPYNHSWNLYFGLGINANFGEADFTGLNIGMVKML